MNETKKMRSREAMPLEDRIYRFGARVSPLLIPFVLGIILGGTLWTYGNAMGQEYFPILTAFSGAAVGVLSAWGLAGRADALRKRRKSNLVRLVIRQLVIAMDKLIAELEHDAETFDIDYAFGIAFLMKRAAQISSKMPNFDDVIETDQDMRMALDASHAFEWVSSSINPPMALESTPPDRILVYVKTRFFASPDAISVVKRMHRQLIEAESHFSDRG